MAGEIAIIGRVAEPVKRSMSLDQGQVRGVRALKSTMELTMELKKGRGSYRIRTDTTGLLRADTEISAPDHQGLCRRA